MSEEINVIHSYSTLDTKVGKLCNGIYRHCWEIDDFVNKLDMKNGESLKSCTFTTKTKNSQTDWCIVLYPNGARPGSVGNLSLFLRRLSKYKLTLAVRITFKILDGNDDTILEKGSQEKDKIYDRVNRNWGIKEFITHPMLKAKGVGSGTEVLKILVEFAFTGEDIFGGSGVSRFRRDEARSVNELSSHIESLYKSGKYSDCKIVCGNEEIQCHKMILTSRSVVFDAMFSHDTKENRSGKIVIEDFDINVVQGMLEYIYSGHVKDIKLIASDLLVAADKYDLQNLKKLCVTSLCINMNCSNVLDILVLSEVYDISTLRSSSLEFIIEHRKEILNQSDWKLKLQNHPRLLAEMFEYLANKH